MEISREGSTAKKSFVLNLPEEGFPADRDKCILRSIISDPDRFLRYLLFLLSEEHSPDNLAAALAQGNSGTGWGTGFSWNLPLFEELLRAFSRDPDKLAHIDSLVDDLSANSTGHEIIPDGFLKLWRTFKMARGDTKGT